MTDTPTPQKGRIFISYRRADSAGYAGRIYDRLSTHFGKDAIFMDVDTIQAGVDFVEVLENAVQSCDVVVVLINRQWLNIKDEAGKQRLDNPRDFVHIEIA
ncbi:MAG TPA: toll/interleukin-1 receptor domain-containing protein, partial [Anaerolineales bacterium]